MRRMSVYMWHLGSGLEKDLGWSLGMPGEIREVAPLVCLLTTEENCLLFLPYPGFPGRGLGLGEVCVRVGRMWQEGARGWQRPLGSGPHCL